MSILWNTLFSGYFRTGINICSILLVYLGSGLHSFFFFGVLSDLYMLDVSPCSLCIDTKCFIVLYCICSCVSIAIMRSLSPVTCNLSKKLELFCFNW